MPDYGRYRVIYKYTCECCNAIYIGKLERQIRCPINEHFGLTVRTGNPAKVLVTSDIKYHCHNHHIPVNPPNFTLLDK